MHKDKGQEGEGFLVELLCVDITAAGHCGYILLVLPLSPPPPVWLIIFRLIFSLLSLPPRRLQSIP